MTQRPRIANLDGRIFSVQVLVTWTVLLSAWMAETGCRPMAQPTVDSNATDTMRSDEAPKASAATPPNPLSGDHAAEKALPRRDPVGGEEERVDLSESEAPVGTKHRFVLLPPDGPILFEVEISVAGRPLADWRESTLNDAFALADLNGDGQVTWEELFESDDLERKYLTSSSALEQGLAVAKERYDLNKNNLVDQFELPRILSGDMTSTQSFVLSSANYYREVNRFASPLFRYLDANSDGALDEPELAAVSLRLRSRDFDQDEYVDRSDLSIADDDTNEVQVGGMSNRAMRNNPYQPSVAIWLGPRAPWGTIRAACTELYAEGERLKADHFPLTPELFEQLDANRDGQLSLNDMSRLAKIQPHVAIRVRLSSDDPNVQPLSDIRLSDSLRDAGVAVDASLASVHLVFPASQVELFAQSAPFQTVERQAARSLAEADADGNQYLDADEFKSVDASEDNEFEQVDSNQNGMVTVDELEVLFSAPKALTDSQVRVEVACRPDALFAMLDADHDRRLSMQEADRAKDELREIDADASGKVTADELPDRLEIGLIQGGNQQTNGQSPPSKADANTRLDAPAWFQAMDHNGDGQVSRREFLGRPERFTRNDANRDGYLSVTEVVVVPPVERE